MEIQTLGILGAGTMGSGIAIASAPAGIEVTLVDVDAAQLEKALAEAKKFYDRAVEKGRMSAEEAEGALGRLTGASDMAAFAESDLVIEAVFEEFDLKARMFGLMSKEIRDETLVATNTSCLRVTDLAQTIARPERFFGLHYFSPAQINPLVEVVRWEGTEESAIQRSLGFLEATGKKPLLCKDAFGFAVNRFFCPYTNEAARLVDEGLATTAQVDRMAKDCLGVAAGPFFVQNIIGSRTNLHAIRNLAPLGPFYAPASLLVEVGEAHAKFEIDADASGIAGNDAIVADRLRGATFLPILEELAEDIAEPADIDMGAVTALRFQEPCKLMDDLGRAEVERLVKPLCDSYGVAMPETLARVGSLR